MWARSALRQPFSKLTKRRCTTSATTAEKVEEKKEPLMEKWKTYWKGVYRDYTTVAKEVIEESRNRPLKALTYLTLSSAATYCAIHNPDETSFTDQLLSSSAELGMVSPSQQNLTSAAQIMFLREERNERRLKRFSFLIFSVIYIDDNSEKCNTYESACNYLSTPLFGLAQRIVDVGFLDRWWVLDKRMENYDINDEEVYNF